MSIRQSVEPGDRYENNWNLMLFGRMYPGTAAGLGAIRGLTFYDMLKADFYFSSVCCVGGAYAEHRLDAKARALRR